MDAARRTTTGGDRVAVDGPGLWRTQEGDDLRHFACIDQVVDGIAGGHLRFSLLCRYALRGSARQDQRRGPFGPG